MPCPICDQKPMNCDCTAEERRQYGEIEELRAEIVRLRLTDEERAAVRTAAGCMGMWMLENGVTEDESMQRSAATLRGLLDRLK